MKSNKGLSWLQVETKWTSTPVHSWWCGSHSVQPRSVLLTRPPSRPAVCWRCGSACNRRTATSGQTWWTCWASWSQRDDRSSGGDTTGPERGTNRAKNQETELKPTGFVHESQSCSHPPWACLSYLDHDVVTGGSFLGFIHPALHHIIAHLHHVLRKQRGGHPTAKHTIGWLPTTTQEILDSFLFMVYKSYQRGDQGWTGHTGHLVHNSLLHVSFNGLQHGGLWGHKPTHKENK